MSLAPSSLPGALMPCSHPRNPALITGGGELSSTPVLGGSGDRPRPPRAPSTRAWAPAPHGGAACVKHAPAAAIPDVPIADPAPDRFRSGLAGTRGPGLVSAVRGPPGTRPSATFPQAPASPTRRGSRRTWRGGEGQAWSGGTRHCTGPQA